MQGSTKYIVLIALFISFVSCAYTPPYSDIAATNIAVEYMKKFKAQKKAPVLFKKSMHYYRKAISLLKRKENKSAKKYLHLARIYAEKAELKSRTQTTSNKEY